MGVLVASALILGPVSASACPTCFGSTSEQVLRTYYLSAAFLTLTPFFVLGALGAWVARHDRRQRINLGTLGDEPPRSAR